MSGQDAINLFLSAAFSILKLVVVVWAISTIDDINKKLDRLLEEKEKKP